AGIELAHGLHHAQPGPHGPLGVIFVCQGIAEVDQQTITEILRNLPLEAGDHLGTGLLIGAHYLAPVFRVKLAGKRSRVHQITEKHSELAAFGLRVPVSVAARLPWRRVRVFLGCWRCACLPHPHEHGALFVHSETLSDNDLGFQILQEGIVHLKFTLEGTIGHLAPTSQQVHHLVQDLIEPHGVTPLPMGRPGESISRTTTLGNGLPLSERMQSYSKTPGVYIKCMTRVSALRLPWS